MPVAEISLYMTIDGTDEDIPKLVLESLDKIDGINTRIFTRETNSINASAEWEESEITKKIEEIRNIDHVIDVNYNKHVTRLIPETLTLSENVSFVAIKDPVGEINRAQSEQDYFKAISYSCSVFEYYGKQILLWYFKKNDTPVDVDRVGRFTLEYTILMLYTHKIIDGSTKIKIFQVTKMRRKFIHEDYSIRLSSEQIEEAKKITPVALESVKSLKAIYNNMANTQYLL